MQLKTILNRRYPLKRFVYSKARFQDDQILVSVRSRTNSRPRCGTCRQPGSVYDTRSERRFEFIPILGMQVFFLYAMRRVNGATCGVKTEHLEWSSGKERMTTAYKWFLSTWARRMSWSEVASVFGTSWNRVYRSVRHAVLWGIVHRETPEFTAIGIDEIAAHRGHRYLTLALSRSKRGRSTLAAVGYYGSDVTAKSRHWRVSLTCSKPACGITCSLCAATCGSRT